jgi:hypothetical protein
MLPLREKLEVQIEGVLGGRRDGFTRRARKYPDLGDFRASWSKGKNGHEALVTIAPPI